LLHSEVRRLIGMTAPDTETEKRPHNFTPTSGFVLVMAIISVLSIPGLGRDNPPPNAMAAVWLLPHLSIVVAMAAGFRVTGDIIALVLGIPLAPLCALFGVLAGLGGTGMQGPDGTFLAFGLVQGLMAIAALLDLIHSRKLPFQPIASRNRLVGLALPAVVFLIGSAMITAAVKRGNVKARSVDVDQMLQAKFERERWMSKSSLDDLVSLAKCVEQFRGDSVAGPAPKNLHQLHDYKDPKTGNSLGCGPFYAPSAKDTTPRRGETTPPDTSAHPREYDPHHIVYYEPPKNGPLDRFHRARFTLGIEALWDSAAFPNAQGQPGSRSYLLDPDGKIHVTQEHRRATTADSVLRECPKGTDQWSHPDTCVIHYETRQRWGARPALPSPSFSIADFVILPESAYVDFSITQTSALDSVRMVSVDWGDGSRPTVIRVAAKQSIAHHVTGNEEHSIWERGFYVYHQYRRDETFEVKASLLTSSGDKFEKQGKVQVCKPQDCSRN
jgi:hypothetical protein